MKLHAQEYGRARCNGRRSIHREPQSFATSRADVTCASCLASREQWKTEDFVEVCIVQGLPLSRVGQAAGGGR